MLVEQIMNNKPYTLEAHHTIRDAMRLMREKKIRHIPIVTPNREVIGVVTQRDLKEAMPSSLESAERDRLFDVTVDQFMIKSPIMAHPLDTVEDLALIFYDAKVGCLPIISNNELVGIVTTTDMLYTYVELTGAHKPGSKLEIRVEDTPGVLAHITKIMADHKTNVQSVLVYPDDKSTTHRVLSIRIQTVNPIELIEDLIKHGFDVLGPAFPGVEF
ncbi:acetoin utilization protein AcuB [Lysinibacillus alkalisoli]|uniref:Acetoin utilization protein AcuB n=1 Tax=Lysinibacillus alkalisoli TaxID=1911548 RepID=A0A917LJC1_9BACI|nr:acetoin utilization AcuB family protein [Lysinibacillus alkalisoli]GGG30053.1 acetoin utilization protein AcuB [Lysinibacillus alkalisoli]